MASDGNGTTNGHANGDGHSNGHSNGDLPSGEIFRSYTADRDASSQDT